MLLRILAGLGWNMRPAGPGVVSGTLIVCKNSSNLDAANGQIHKNYNGWIENVNNAIHRELLRV